MLQVDNEPLSTYFAAINSRDLDKVVERFTEDAVVRDEGGQHEGHNAIRAWLDDTITRYAFVLTPLHAEPTESGACVTARVEGTFPGSPAELRFAFILDDDRIAQLEIG